jgi:DNA-binding protein HU-beta
MTNTTNPKVTKTLFISQVAEKAGVSQVASEKLINSMIEVIEVNLKKGNSVAITGFGTFKKTIRKARNGINPKTQQKMKIAESTSVSFKAGKTLKEAVSPVAKKK